jgi:hypothetical protein
MFVHSGVRAFATCGPSVIWYRTKSRGAQIAYSPASAQLLNRLLTRNLLSK